MPLPVSASRVTREWLAAAARIFAARSVGVELSLQKACISTCSVRLGVRVRSSRCRRPSAACAKAWERGVHERIVSVRPCLKAAVEADS
eukprot:scaffold104622_cov70-Phaeocystis_antarctica.AAC.3